MIIERYPQAVTLLRPVILSGGSGTRLWPLSTPERPKQFADLIDGTSLFGATLTRIADLDDIQPPIVVAGADHLGLIEETAGEVDVELGVIIIEPVGRNTAPAIAAAALHSDPDEILVILPSDHLIHDVVRFQGHVLEAAELAVAGHIVAFGITPTRPDTGYGYIQTGDQVGSARRLVRFKEKPTREEAEALISDGDHLWNSGMFVARAGTLVEEMELACPDVLEPVRAAMTVTDDDICLLGHGFAEVEKISFDHAVMEHTTRGVVVPIDVGWDDIGSYVALLGNADRDEHGNVLIGNVVTEDVTGAYVNASTRTVVVAGLSDIIVVETEEGVLVVPLDRAQDVRSLAEQARQVEG